MDRYGSMISCQDPPHLFGAYSGDLYIHPRAMVHKIGDDITPELGVLVGAVLGNAVRWISFIGNVPPVEAWQSWALGLLDWQL